MGQGGDLPGTGCAQSSLSFLGNSIDRENEEASHGAVNPEVTDAPTRRKEKKKEEKKKNRIITTSVMEFNPCMTGYSRPWSIILDCRWRINDPCGVQGGGHSFQ